MRELELHQLDLRYEELRVRSPARERGLYASLDECGQQVPIVVVALEDDPQRFLVIDDGFKRIRALRRLKRDTVGATVLDLGETEALVLGGALGMVPGLSGLEQGWLVAELQRSRGLSAQELGRRFGRSPSWVSRRLGLVQDLPESVQEHIRRGKIPAQAAMRSLVPLARAAPKDCEKLAQAIAGQGLTSREIQVLYRAWQDGSALIRQRLIDNPQLYLRALEEMAQKKPVEPDPAAALLADVDRIAILARRSEQRWCQKPRELTPAEHDRVASCLQQGSDAL